jgi:hypothetical protein
LSDATGQIIGNDGLHATVLAHVSLVSKVQQLSRDRQERWRCLSDINRRWSRTSFYSDSATRAVVDATTWLNLDQRFAQVHAGRASKETANGAWKDAAFNADAWLQLTPTGPAELLQQIVLLARRWSTRKPPTGGA